MKRHTIVFVFSFVLLLSTAGCSRLNCTRLESILGSDINLISLGQDIGKELVKRSYPPLLPRQPQQPVLVTTLVNNDNLGDSTSFGRSLQNSIAAAFVGQGFTVHEVKLRDDVVISPEEGEFMLSRDLNELNGKQRAQGVVVGTYTMANRVMYLSVRLVKPGDSSIRSVYEKRLCLDENSLRMLDLGLQDQGGVEQPGEPFLDKVLY